MRELIPRTKPGDRLSHALVNQLSETAEMANDFQPGSYSSGRQGTTIGVLPFQQRMIQIVDEEFDLGEADGLSGIYEIRFRFYDSVAKAWSTDDEGTPQLLDANATGDTFAALAIFPAYWDDQRGMWVKAGGPTTANTSSSSAPLFGNGCGCCASFNCVTAEQAIVAACSACPDGAPNSFTVDFGIWNDFPSLAGIQTLHYGTLTNDCGSPVETADAEGSGCVWSSCIVTVAGTIEGSSSSSGNVAGFYQWVLTIGIPTTLQLTLVGGTDVVGLDAE